jgi:hypothetical protein
MKRHMIPMTMSFLTVVILLMPASVFSQSTMSGATGAGVGSFPGGTTFSGVSVSGLQFGMGVFVPGDTTAAGQVQMTLSGTSALGQPQNIEIGGDSTSGAINTDGSRSFSGTATVDMGDGTPPLTAVPFTVRASANTLLVTVGVNNLPLASLTAGSIIID